MLDRRRLLSRLLGLGAAALTLGTSGIGRAALRPAEKALIARIEAYLDGLRNLEARFTQIGPDGQVATGTFYLSRPGKLRIDYDPPSKLLLLATDWRLIFYDGSIQQVNTIPLAQTPLGFLLAEKVSLEGEVTVQELRQTANEIAITVTRSAAPDQGSVTLVFARKPLELRRWRVIDPQGLATEVILEDMRTDVAFAPELFHWRDPRIFGFPED